MTTPATMREVIKAAERSAEHAREHHDAAVRAAAEHASARLQAQPAASIQSGPETGGQGTTAGG